MYSTCLSSIAFPIMSVLTNAFSIVAVEAIFHASAVVSTEFHVAPVFAAVLRPIPLDLCVAYVAWVCTIAV